MNKYSVITVSVNWDLLIETELMFGTKIHYVIRLNSNDDNNTLFITILIVYISALKTMFNTDCINLLLPLKSYYMHMLYVISAIVN